MLQLQEKNQKVVVQIKNNPHFTNICLATVRSCNGTIPHACKHCSILMTKMWALGNQHIFISGMNPPDASPDTCCGPGAACGTGSRVGQ